MRRLPRETYSLFVALLPATAAVVGVIVLGQIPAAIEVVGVAPVILGVAMHQERGTGGRHPPTHDTPTKCDQTRANTQRRTDSPAPTDLSVHHHSQSANEHNHRQVPSQVDECGPTGRDAARAPNPDYVGFGRGPGDGVMYR